MSKGTGRKGSNSEQWHSSKVLSISSVTRITGFSWLSSRGQASAGFWFGIVNTSSFNLYILSLTRSTSFSKHFSSTSNSTTRYAKNIQSIRGIDYFFFFLKQLLLLKTKFWNYLRSHGIFYQQHHHAEFNIICSFPYHLCFSAIWSRRVNSVMHYTD